MLLKVFFDADFKNVISCFVAHLLFEMSVCFGFQLPSLPQACEQQKIALFCIVTLHRIIIDVADIPFAKVKQVYQP